MTMAIEGQPVPLPAGWQVEPGRETSQIVNGTTMQGLTFNLVMPAKNVTTSVFVPYAVMGNTQAVAAMFADRINSITAIQGLAGT